MWIGNVVELHDEIRVQVEEDAKVVDKFIHNLQGPLGINDGGFAQAVLQVVDDLNVGLLDVALFLDISPTLDDASILDHRLQL